MTVSNTQIRVSYTGNGATTAFPIPYPFYLATDIEVLLAGAQQGSGYAISGGEDASGNPQTGTCTFATAPGSGLNVQLILNVPLTQLVQLVDGTAFPSATVNQVNDRAIQAALRLNDIVTRAIRAQDGDVNPSMQLPVAAARANLALTFDGNGNVLLAPQPVAGSITQAIIGQLLYPTLGSEVGVANNAIQYGNVLRFGADPTGGASSRAAFNNCYTSAMATTPHGAIYIPAGTYLIDSPGLTWTNQNDIRVYGDGPNQSVLIGSNSASYTILTISADTGHGTTGLNLNLAGFGIRNNGAASGTHGLYVADYLYGTIENMEIQSSGNALTMAGMANITSKNLNVLSWESNAAGNSALTLKPDTDGVFNGPLVFMGSQFEGSSACTQGAAVNSNGTYSTTFIGCNFEALGPSLVSVCEFANGDEITCIECYSESSCNTTANTAVLFYLGRTAAPLSFSLIGGHWFNGTGGFNLNYFILGNSIDLLTVMNVTFANPATAAINYATNARSAVTVINSYCSPAPLLTAGVGPPGAPNLIQLWTTPVFQWPSPIAAGFGAPTGAGVIANFPGGTATLAQCSETIAEILNILKTGNVIGA